MAEKPDDLNLPAAIVKRIVKDSLPDGINVSKEARSAIARAASVYVLYSATCANNFAMAAKRKTLSANDVLEAIKEMEFEEFIEPLKECLAEYKKISQNKKEAKKEKLMQATEIVKDDFTESGKPESESIQID